MTTSGYARTLCDLDAAKESIRSAMNRLAANSETDKASFKALAALDAIDAARNEVALRIMAAEEIR